MKRHLLFFLSLGIFAGFVSCESQKSISDIIYNKYGDQAGVSFIALPPNFIDNFVKEDRTEEKKLLNQVRDMKLMTFNDENGDNKGESVYDEVNNLLNRRNFEELMSINKNGLKFTVKMKQRKEMIREMYVLVRGEQKFFLASLTGRIDLNTFNDAFNKIDFNDFGEIEGFTKGFDFEPEDFKISF